VPTCKGQVMKLVIFIPCYNEEETLPIVLKSLPKHIKGIDEIETLIVDDGSSDKTIEIAKKFGIKHFIYHRRNQGLARSFRHGLMGSVELGADIVLITDADNQYKQERIPELIQPILDGRADVVLADRMTQTVEDFSPMKKALQRFGTGILNKAADTDVPDVMTGFRAYSRQAAMQLNPIADFSWAPETTMQSSQKRHRIVSVEIPTNPKLRESRQYKSPWVAVRRGSKTISRVFVMYKPYKFFFSVATTMLVLGVLPLINFAYDYFAGQTRFLFGAHPVEGLVLSMSFLLAAFLSALLGVVTDMIRINRQLIEETLYEARRTRLNK
jgi:glycosyltransferase involved in cell wall biosynthesis